MVYKIYLILVYLISVSNICIESSHKFDVFDNEAAGPSISFESTRWSLSEIQVTNVEECMDTCYTEEGCKAVAFDVHNMTCEFKSIVIGKEEKNGHDLYMKIPSEIEHQYKLYKNSIVTLNFPFVSAKFGLSTIPNTDVEECLSICNSEPLCRAITFNITGNNCNLKSSFTGETFNNDCHTYVKLLTDEYSVYANSVAIGGTSYFTSVWGSSNKIVKDLTECLDVCSLSSKCRAVTFHVSLHCYLGTEFTSITNSTGYSIVGKMPKITEYEIHVDRIFGSQPYYSEIFKWSSMKGLDIEICLNVCTADLLCKGFVYRTSGKRCHLITEISSQSSSFEQTTYIKKEINDCN
ncbi:DgyrCDS14762 [Dimorphilus gyrociliatus]|uniref:DgyrCDS14762 n=1 Tax=Dimorphilus gyrociliatus TaxID=2664684 RepID=A0A7I8WES9_9ANNE|nr:DgyrCDS14762 [Dimorphilus gyrociliatus]